MMETVSKMVKDHVRLTYGNLIQCDDQIYDDDNEEWNINLKSNYPKIIVDDSDPPVRELFFVKLSSLGKIKIHDDEILYYTPRKNVINNIKDNMNIWIDRVERVIIKASASNLVFTPTIQHYLNPLRRILSTILLTGNITSTELNRLPKSERAYDWLQLLLNENIVAKTNNGYQYGSMWTMLKDRIGKPDDEFIKMYNLTSLDKISKDNQILLLHLIMSYILEENSGYIRKVMNLKSMNRLLNVNNVYYRPCLNSEKLLRFKPRTILYEYSKAYGNLAFPLISSTLTELISVGLLQYSNGLIEGSERHLDAMIKLEPPSQVSLPAA